MQGQRAKVTNSSAHLVRPLCANTFQSTNNWSCLQESMQMCMCQWTQLSHNMQEWARVSTSTSVFLRASACCLLNFTVTLNIKWLGRTPDQPTCTRAGVYILTGSCLRSNRSSEWVDRWGVWLAPTTPTATHAHHMYNCLYIHNDCTSVS